MAKFICYTPTTSTQFITEQGVLMNSRTSTKQNILIELGGICRETGKYSTWEFSDNTKVEFTWVMQYWSEDSKFAKYQELRDKKLSPTAL